MRKIVLVIVGLFPLIASADPAPFGLEIGRTTVKELKAKYGVKRAGINEYSRGEMYQVDVGDLGFAGLKSCLAVFDKEGKLAAILTTVSKDRFDDLFGTLKAKYKLQHSQIPFVGNKSARFQDGSARIMLDAPHLSFTMEMNYIRNDLWKAFREQSQRREQKKKQKEAGQL